MTSLPAPTIFGTKRRQNKVNWLELCSSFCLSSPLFAVRLLWL